MNKEKRKLDSKELSMTVRGLNNKKEEKEWLEYQIEYHGLMLKMGLEMNYKKNIRDFKQNKGEHERDLEIANNIINILQDQIRNGIEVKEKKEEIKLEDN